MEIKKIVPVMAFLGTLAGLTYLANITEHKSPSAKVSVATQNKLLDALPKKMRDRIQELLVRQYNVCPDINFEPRPFFFTQQSEEMQRIVAQSDAMLKDGKTGQINCMATVLWVVAGDLAPRHSEAMQFLILLEDAGYSIIRTIKDVFEVSGDGYAQGMKKDLNKEELVPGDVLVFTKGRSYYEGEENQAYVAHAAIYLGRDENGRHIMFYKTNRLCGPDFPYKTEPLDAYADRRLGNPIQYVDDGSFENIIVYRKAPPPAKKPFGDIMPTDHARKPSQKLLPRKGNPPQQAQLRPKHHRRY